MAYAVTVKHMFARRYLEQLLFQLKFTQANTAPKEKNIDHHSITLIMSISTNYML